MMGIVIDLDLFMPLLKIYVNHKQILYIQMTQDAHTQFTKQVKQISRHKFYIHIKTYNLHTYQDVNIILVKPLFYSIEIMLQMCQEVLC